MSARQAIVFVGLMGSGKTTVGKRVAQELGFAFVDSDDLITQKAGKSVRDIFSQDGEQVFRSYETEAIREALCSGTSNVVLATGGGAVISESNRKMFQDCATRVIWLDASIDDFVTRTKYGVARPLLDGNAEQTLKSLSEQRASWYEQVADIRIDTRGKSAAKVCSQVVDELRSDDSDE